MARKRFDFGPAQNRITIPWDGPHTLEFRNDSCCNRKEVTVGTASLPPAGEDHLYVNLDPKPARLSVDLLPSRNDVTILLREVGGRTAENPGAPVLSPARKCRFPLTSATR